MLKIGKRKQWSKLEDEYDNIECHQDNEIEHGTVCLDDVININTIRFTKFSSDDWVISFMLGKDSIKIPNVSERYCDELKKIIQLKHQKNIDYLCVDFTKLRKTDPQSVWYTFY